MAGGLADVGELAQDKDHARDQGGFGVEQRLGDLDEERCQGAGRAAPRIGLDLTANFLYQSLCELRNPCYAYFCWPDRGRVAQTPQGRRKDGTHA